MNEYPHEFEEDILAARRIEIRPMHEDHAQAYTNGNAVALGLVFCFTFLAVLAVVAHIAR